ncbi:MAG: glycosyltransferase, partial [Pseudomonadota bacterium]
KESHLFKDLRVEVIPNSLETDLYTPSPKAEAKRKLGLEGDTVTLLFGGEDGNERRKGFKELIAAIQCCLKDGEFQVLLRNGKIRLICFGHPNDEIEALGIPVDPLGYLDSDEKIRDAYTGADIFILPSLEDNLPNTVLEAMSCGTPVVAFDTGGIPEMVANGITGQVVPLGDSVKMGEALVSLIFSSEKRETMGKECRKKIEKEYALNIQAGAYLDLYEELARKNSSSRQVAPAVTGKGNWEAAPGSNRPELLSAPFEAGIVPHFGIILNQVMFQALKEFAPRIHEQWQASEADRKTRLDQIKELADLLNKSEADRKARLDQTKELTKLLGESEVDRKARLDQINELTDQINKLNNMLGESEANRKAKFDQLNELSFLLGVEADRTSMQAAIQELRDVLARESKRVRVAEEGWKNLEATFAVRQARKLGLVRAPRCQLTDNAESKTKRRNRPRLIAVDMTPVLPGGENGGAKILAIELLRSLKRAAPEDHFLLLTAFRNHEELAMLDGPNMSRTCVLTGKKGRSKPLTAQYPGFLRSSLDRMGRYIMRAFKTGVAPRRLLGSRGVDLLFCPFTAPTYAEPGIPTVSVIYDLQHRDLPQFFSPHEIGVRNSFMSRVSQQADHIICISENVRQAVLKHLKTDPERTHTVHVCIQSRLSIPDPENVDKTRSELGIGFRPYMFYPANYWPHKNHRMLLTAYGMFLSRNPESDLDLVFTGALEELEKDLKRAVEQMGLTERVHFLGFLPHEQLEVVWYGCDFLIFPSLYEGFGIPVLEAMSIRKPVLCSNTTSLPEVAGKSALYFDPRKPGDIVNCLERMANDSALREDLSNRGYSRAANFRSETMIHKYLDVFSSALGNSLPISDGVTGIFQDGWIGEEMMITFGPGPKNRAIRICVSAPPWLPAARVKLKLRDGDRIVQRLSIRRGREITISQPLPEEKGCFTLTVAPTFRPSECKIGEDNRVLGVKCQGCWLIHPDQEKTSLMKAGKKCSPVSA